MAKQGSSKPAKQRSLLYRAPQHIRHKLLSAPLSSALRERYKRRSFPLRQGDTVRIMRGDFAGIEGKVVDIDTERQRVYIEGVTREKVAGETARVPIHASKVMITSLSLDDKWRAESLKRKLEKGEEELVLKEA